jgi:hypothetical protein
MTILFDGDVHVHYGQVYLASEGSEGFSDPMNACFAGQANGLAGAATPGGVFLVTGLHTGHVPITVELHDRAPALDERWEEIVEVSFHPTGRVSLTEWAGEASSALAVDQVGHRVRYSALGMDEAHDQDTRLDDEAGHDRYLLQLWPAPPAPDTVVKQTSAQAAYWHTAFAAGA